MKPEKRIELLAPCGSWEALEAVCAAGADAVYFSEKRFAMRQHGAWLNFGREEVGEVVRYAHRHGVKAYLALNNLLTGEELGLLEGILPELEAAGPDAFIIQDLGLLRTVRKLGLKTPLHASTMMNVHHPRMADFLRELGIRRIITSRDITVHAAGEIARASGIEVEYFVHGDMCVAQSSQCLHSGIATEYSANRGKCLKSCRWPWSLVDREQDRVLAHVEEQHVLARKDLCLYHQLPLLVSEGIASLKIEGRARPGDYLAPIVTAYREAIDRYYDDPGAYSTDFEVLRRLRSTALREVGTSHAFGQPGPGSSGLSGQREPKLFSIAVEERPSSEVGRVTAPQGSATPELSVRCMTEAAATALLDTPCDWIYVGGEHYSSREGHAWHGGALREFIGRCHDAGKRVGLQTPRITTTREYTDLERLLERLGDQRPDLYLAHNTGTLAWLREQGVGPVHADFSFNVWNGESVRLLREQGVAGFTAALELTLEQVEALGRESAGTLPVECVVHGSLPGMLLEFCVIGTHMTGTTRNDPCPGPCTQRNYALRDRLGHPHWLETDQYCRNHLFMVRDLCAIGVLDRLLAAGTARLRIEAPLYAPEYLAGLVGTYREAIDALARGEGYDGGVLLERIRRGAPRPLGDGAFGNQTVAISEPCSERPEEVVIRYTPERRAAAVAEEA
ncbi:MAG: U32 family peptidase [Gammaproteobacteria bacterium]|nr:MAG: U32 family peptidase [Gammaproteobacteria bacterium]